MEKLKDLYQIYLSYMLGKSPEFEENVETLLACSLGTCDHRYNPHVYPLSKKKFYDKIGELTWKEEEEEEKPKGLKGG